MRARVVLGKQGDNDSNRLDLGSLQILLSPTVLFCSTLIRCTHQWLTSISAVQVYCHLPAILDQLPNFYRFQKLLKNIWGILCGLLTKASLCLKWELQWVLLLHLACMECPRRLYEELGVENILIFSIKFMHVLIWGRKELRDGPLYQPKIVLRGQH